MTVYGWDASDFDWDRGPMDLGAAVRDGIQFFTHKATEGTRVQHVHYREALERARDAGMRAYGAYIVVRTPGNGGHGSVAAQVAYFLAYLDAQTPWWRSDPRYRIGQVDTEHWSDSNGVVYDAVAPQYGAEACALLRQQTSLYVPHYAPAWAYGNTIPGDDPLWASSYGANPAAPYRQTYPGDGSSAWKPYSGRTPAIVQYGSRATIGRQPGCDINAINDPAVWAALTGGTTVALKDEPLLSSPEVSIAQAIDDLWHGWYAGHSGFDPTGKDRHFVNRQLNRIEAAAGTVSASGAPTQDQVDAAMLKALSDPAVQAGLGAAIASHIKVT